MSLSFRRKWWLFIKPRIELVKLNPNPPPVKQNPVTEYELNWTVLLKYVFFSILEGLILHIYSQLSTTKFINEQSRPDQRLLALKLIIYFLER